MPLVRTAIYHLFAPTAHPRRSIHIRLLVFIGVLLVLGWLSHRMASTSLGLVSQHGGIALVYAVTCVFTMLLYILSAGAHRSFMERLQPFQYMPLRPTMLHGIQAITYLPITLASAVLVIPGVCTMFAVSGGGVLIAATFGAFLAVVGNQIALRTAGGWIGTYAQGMGVIIALSALVVCWQLVRSNHAITWEIAAGGLACTQAFGTIYAYRRGPRPCNEPHAARRIEWERPGRIGSFAVRAFRMRRFRAANITLFLLCIGLTGYVAWDHQAVPFDAVAVVCLLLTGTLGQEARAVSRTRYPVELILYGQLGIWLRGMWLLAFGNAIFFTEVLLLIAIVGFSHTINVSYEYMMCVGLGMVGVGIMAGSVIVSARSDVLAQLASTVLYGGLAYGVLQVMGSHAGQELGITGALVGLGLAVSYAVEKMRWMRSIRGKYVVI